MSVPHDMPTLDELVEAVHEFIESDVMGAVDGSVRFHARVAANVLAIVRRELELGEAHAAAHAERLGLLGLTSERELAEAIRAGTLDDRVAEVREIVTATVADKLAVANPGYTVR